MSSYEQFDLSKDRLPEGYLTKGNIKKLAKAIEREETIEESRESEKKG